jgi:hypothetical protein
MQAAQGLDWDDNGESFVRSILQPHNENIKDTITAAWKRYLSMPEENRFPLNPRARANVVNSYICHEIEHHTFIDVPGVSIIENTNFPVLNFSNLVLLRFKFLDRNYRPRNIQTQLQRDYDNLVELPNFPAKAIRVVAGYQLDRAEQAIKDIPIIRSICGKNVWRYSIFSDNASILQLTLPNEATDDQLPKRIIKPKNLEKLDENNDIANDPAPKEIVKPKIQKKSEGDNSAKDKQPRKRIIKPKNLEKLDENNDIANDPAPKRAIKPTNQEKPGEENDTAS